MGDGSCGMGLNCVDGGGGERTDVVDWHLRFFFTFFFFSCLVLSFGFWDNAGF